MTRRRPTSPAAPVPPTEDDDLLSEILLRLPPQPSSLPRASLVCKRWRRRVTDPQFLRLFRAHHRKPPLLGFFFEEFDKVIFSPTLDPPDSIPTVRFFLRMDDPYRLISCRHGRVLLLERLHLVVWDPVTGDQLSVAVPSAFDLEKKFIINGAVLCPHVRSSTFKVVLVGTNASKFDKEDTIVFVCVYSSETGMWSDIVSASIQPLTLTGSPSTLVGNSIHWLLRGPSAVGNGILRFDLDGQNLSVLMVPLDVYVGSDGSFIVPVEGGGLGLIVLSGFSAKLWKMKAECDCVAGWVLGRTIELDKLLPLSPATETVLGFSGFAEDDNVIFLWTSAGIFMVHLDSMESKKLADTRPFNHFMNCWDLFYCHPFNSLYTAGGFAPGSASTSRPSASSGNRGEP